MLCVPDMEFCLCNMFVYRTCVWITNLMVKVFFYKECQTVLIETEEKQMFYLFVLLLFKGGNNGSRTRTRSTSALRIRLL